MAGIGVKQTGPGHVLKHDGHGATVPVGAGEYTSEALGDALLFADQTAVN